ncbi:MAG TPA: hypothetical protein DEB39_12820 [Planctomycetaceae bacterium]|nr:hypothetical protein [Planctomycetaceae bacterium]
MKKQKIIIRSIKERRFVRIPIDKIVVINSRRRDEERFKETIRSISELGLYKPICVNSRRLKKTGMYELVSGEGRLEACRQLGMTHIEAEIIDVDDEFALLSGLAENFTRKNKNVIDFAKRILQMFERGMSYAELARITGKSATTMSSYIALMQKGEERLIRGVEEGVFSLSFAMQVIENPLSETQHFIMNEYQNGRISDRDLGRITKILKERAEKGLSNADMTMKKLTATIKVKTKECKMLYEQGKAKRDDVLHLRECLLELWKDEKFSKMADVLKDLPRPELKGQYGN